jgi:hypothetical protein
VTTDGLTPKGVHVARLSEQLRQQGHDTGLTDAEEIREDSGQIVPAGTYLICLKCGRLWPT